MSDFSYDKNGIAMICTPTARINEVPPYRPLTPETALRYLSELGAVDRYLGGAPEQWQAQECGDGNLNLVFVVKGTLGAVVVKQALPYVRMVGDSWPLSLRRNYFEHTALREQVRWAADFVPVVYHADDAMALFVMECLTPHTVLRSGWISGRTYAHVGQHLGMFLARTQFNTSAFRLPSVAKKEGMSAFLANTAMCQISEDLIFDEPYFAAPLNRHTSPQLDLAARALTEDIELKVAVQAMKWRFMQQPDCLLHGDLHTGSVMVTDRETRVIDPEFACHGPMGFDIGVLMANFLMAYLSQPGHAACGGERDEVRRYLLDQLKALWNTFSREFSRLCRERSAQIDSSLFNPRLNLDSPDFSEKALACSFERIWQDALGFAGCEIIRRIVGLAHVADFEAIIDPDRRAECERRALLLARALLMERPRYRSILEVTAAASAHG